MIGEKQRVKMDESSDLKGVDIGRWKIDERKTRLIGASKGKKCEGQMAGATVLRTYHKITSKFDSRLERNTKAWLMMLH